MVRDVSQFAAEWVRAWNAHDLEAILNHYAEGVQFRSPFVAKLTGDERGWIKGKAALRAYFGRALAAYPDLQFVLHDTLAGVGSVTLYYTSVGGRHAAEVMLFDDEGLVHTALCHYDRW